MPNRYYERDRYRNEGSGDYSDRGVGRRSFRDRPLSRRDEDERDFRSRDAFVDREYERQYGMGYEPGYGMSSPPRYRNRYRSNRSEYAGEYDRGYRGDNRSGRSGYDRNFDPGELEYADRGWWERMSDEVASWFGDEEAERRRRMDEVAEGNYRGKGPRGYTRSDERIREDVSDRLTDYSHLDASDIDVTVVDGVVKLEGWVDSRWAKRSTEDIVETVSGVKDVQNNLRVGRAASDTVETGEPLGATKTRAKGA